MKRLSVLLAILLLTQGVLPPASAACPEMEEIPHDGYLIQLAEDAPVPLSVTLEYVVPGVYWTADEQLAEAYADYGLAELVEPNYQVTLLEQQTILLQQTDVAWAYTAMRADAANNWGLSGEGVRIAVIDSGLQAENENLDHAVIAAGYDYTEETAVMTDTQGHGTYVAQMIAGDGDNGMMKGIAPAATLVPLRCFGEKTSNVATLIRAIEDAADPEGFACDIINMSWGMDGNSALLAETLQRASDAGVVLVAAAGNVESFLPQGTVCYPAALDTVIGVGAVGENKAVAPFSQQTVAVNVCAPGQLIPACSLDQAKVGINGTSFAAPCVSALLALVLEAAPEMTPAFAAELLRRNAEDLGDTGWDAAYGHGFTDVSLLLTQDAWTIDQAGTGQLGCWLPATEARTVYAAAYSNTGRLTALTKLRLPAGRLGGCWDLPPNAVQRRVFVLSEGLLPLCEPIV